MVKIIDIGMNHHTAPVELRECLATDTGNVSRALTSMRGHEAVKEGIYISTCNRVEAVVITERPEEASRWTIRLLSELGNVPEEALCSSLYMHEDMGAVKHLFRVASSLDSMVVGEPQILGQLKDAYSKAVEERTSGVILNRLMHRAFHVAKRVRTETGICEAAVSISYAAVELAKKIFHVLEGKRVLLIGAGDMAEIAAKHLLGQGISSMAIANRTFSRAVQMAREFNAQAVSFEEIEGELYDADIVITSTASPGYVINAGQVRSCLRRRRNRPLFFIDIAVPRDVQPEVNDLENVYVYDIDDLKDVVELNMDQRKQEAIRAERIVEEEVVKFEKWLKTLAVVPTIISLREKADTILRGELKKSRSLLEKLTSDQIAAVETLNRSIAEKLINDPILFLKGKADRPALDMYIDVTRKLFGLDKDTDGRT